MADILGIFLDLPLGPTIPVTTQDDDEPEVPQYVNLYLLLASWVEGKIQYYT